TKLPVHGSCKLPTNTMVKWLTSMLSLIRLHMIGFTNWQTRKEPYLTAISFLQCIINSSNHYLTAALQYSYCGDLAVKSKNHYERTIYFYGRCNAASGLIGSDRRFYI